MTVFKALAVYLKSKEGNSDFGCTFYPSQAPDNATRPYAIFSIKDDVPQLVHDGLLFSASGEGYNNGNMIVQFDIFCDSLTDLDDRVYRIKNNFIGRSLLLDSSVKMAYADSDNEFDAFDERQKLWIRSFDLNMKYILTNN